MPVCEDVAKLAGEIRGLLHKQKETRLNQTAALDGNKVTDIKSSVGAYHRTPKGKAVIYTGQAGYPTLEPGARDVREMIEHERPFICRCVMAFGVPQAACYTPGDSLYRFVKEDIEQVEELSEGLKAEVMRLWGADKPQTYAEKAFTRELSIQKHELNRILEDLAGKVLKTCRVSLK